MNADLWDVVVNRVVLLNTKWRYWRQLFGTPAGVAVLNQLAPSCFALIQESMLLDIIASTARLLDRASNRSQENLVIESLLADIQSGDEKTKIESELNEIKARADAITKIRHKVIAHEDRLAATGLADLAPADTALIGELIDRINALMRAMESAAPVPYPHAFNAVSVRGSGDTVLWLLRMAASGVSPNAEVPDGSNVAMIPVRLFS